MSIYKITNTITEHYYFGSTADELEVRMNVHKDDAIKFPNRKSYKKFLEIGLDNLRIELIQKCTDVETDLELELIEDTYIRPVYKTDPLCLNSRVNHILTSKEEYIKDENIRRVEAKHNWEIQDKEENPEKYETKNAHQREKYWENHEAELLRGATKRENNREVINEKSKEYYQRVKGRRAEEILCKVCNKYVTSANMKRHTQSTRHQQALPKN